MKSRTLITFLAATAVSAGATFALMPLSNAADGTGAYGEFAVNSPPTNGFITFSGTIFPSATFTSTDASLSVARSATLTTRSEFGAYFGSSTGKTYLSSAIASGKPRGTLTITFDSPPVPGTWAFALGDVDAEDVVVSGTTPSGRTVDANDWVHDGFNYTATGTDIPRWDATTSTVIGNGSDTDGASIWMSPTQEVESITLTQVRRSGFPQYQLWIAADIITTADVPDPDPTETTIPKAPEGKVVICHATSSTRNPYNEITVSTQSVTQRNGHDSHTGGLFPAPNWGDIIPPFEGFKGLNWPAGASILNNNCEVGTERLSFQSSASPSPTATSSPTGSPSASPTASPTATATASPTASPTGSVTPTASPSPTTTSSPSPSPTVTASPTATMTPTASPSPTATTTVTPTASPTPIPTNTVEEVPADRPTVIDRNAIPNIPPGSTITDVEEPKNGTAEVRNGEVIFTPDPGFRGEERIIVIITTSEGATKEVAVDVVVGKEQKVITRWKAPKSLELGMTRFAPATLKTNANQSATVTASCALLLRLAPADGVVGTRCSVIVNSQGTFIDVDADQPVGVEVLVRAPKKGEYGPLKERYFYRVNP
jgi:hypothetical protein